MRISEKQKGILKMIGLGVLLLPALTSPNFLINLVKSKRSTHKYRTKKVLERLAKNDIIYLFGEEVRLTDKGRELLKIIEVEEIEITRQKVWDGIWHIVCYDIPERKKKQRDALRLKLAKLGFKFIQDSLWVYPYECKQEIAVISQTLGVSPYVAYLNTDFLPQQEKLIKWFGLK